MPTTNDANGTPQRITDKGLALNYSTILSMSAHAGDLGDCYTALIEVDTGAVTCDFFYLKNTSEKTLRIYKIKAKTHTADAEIQIKTSVTGSPSGGSAVTPINALIGSGSLAECTCEQRATGDMALTGGNIFDSLFLDAAIIGEQVFDYPGEIALEKNQAMIFHAVGDTGGSVNMTVYFYFHEEIK